MREELPAGSGLDSLRAMGQPLAGAASEGTVTGPSPEGFGGGAGAGGGSFAGWGLRPYLTKWQVLCHCLLMAFFSSREDC